ncbi:hypothetical protein ASE01_19725 [Nocardioides sp. Root190]|uniref:MSCRAMM family protein n=1 Tax=Nocardioides sp. Root190 TaxID=1736488 RepID=UPI0006FD9D81|nr:carboxypeptidase-like regulatory domain-containing protein [Nocardioides sp. Root190]KRB73009.1 hypothetical protein ASE01_19725 [Nocardioides sp. Root190]
MVASLVVFLASGLTLGFAAPVRAVDYGSIHVTVVDDVTGAPVSNAPWGLAREYGTRSWGPVDLGDPKTSADGRIYVGVTPGKYRLNVLTTHDYVGRWYGGATDVFAATDIVVGPGETREIVLRLPRAGHVKGSVRSDVDRSPMAGVRVQVLTTDIDGAPQTARSARTAADGSYDVGGLEAGRYRVQFTPDQSHLPEYWSDKSTWATAAWIGVPSRATIGGIDASLVKSSSLTGRVVFDDGRGPVAFGSVQVYRGLADDDAGRVTIAPDGRFEVRGLSAGTYRVVVRAEYSVEEWFSDAASRQLSTPVVVAPADVTSLGEIRVAPPGSISGRVTDASGLPLSGVKLRAAGEGPQVHATTAADGTYTLAPVTPGEHLVHFNGSGYVEEYFDDSLDPFKAPRVLVRSGRVTSGIDAVLTATATITGSVSDLAGAPASGVRVQAMALESGDWIGIADSWTDSSGAYELSGLRPGIYTLGFRTSDRRHAATFLGGGFRLSSARRVVVNEGVTIADQDGSLAATAQVRGTVRLDGMALAGKPIRVDSVSPDYAYSDDEVHYFLTSAGGTFNLTGLQPGRYSFRVYCDTPAMFQGPKDLAGIVHVDVLAGQSAVRDLSFPASACLIRPTVAPRLVAANRVGQTIRVRRGTYDPGVVTTRIVWTVGSRRIGTTRPELKVLRAYRGKRIKARIIVERRGYRDLVYTFRSGVIR